MTPDAILQSVRAAFADALGRQILDHEDFFAVGGDSLSAEHVMTALSAVLSLDLPVWVLLDHPTAADLAQVIGRTLSQRP
jgi:acyl carrier protein